MKRADMIAWLEKGAEHRMNNYETARTNREKKALKKAAHIMRAIAAELRKTP